MAEAILNRLGADRFLAASAGSRPAGHVNPAALCLLGELGYDSGDFASKSWNVFAAADAPRFDVVITVCDAAAGEPCPAWPGAPLTAHWGIADPAAVRGPDEEIRRAFETAYEELLTRIRKLLALPLDSMSRTEMRAALRAVGEA